MSDERTKLIEEMARAYWDCNRLNYVPPWNSGKIHPKQMEAVRVGIRGSLERLDELGYAVVPKPAKRSPMSESIAAQIEQSVGERRD